MAWPISCRPVADYACHTGENPLWHPQEAVLYWVDIPRGRLFRYEPETGHHEAVFEGRPVGGFTVEADGSLLLFMDRGRVVRWRDGAAEAVVIEAIEAMASTRFNDVIADPAGRVFAGAMPAQGGDGRLYRIDRDGTFEVVLEGIGTPNGMGFSADGATFYFTDTKARRIDAFDYEVRTGAISNRRPFIEVPADPPEGRPDGMTIDDRGRFWSARWDGGCVVAYDRQGREVERIPVPEVRKVSSVTFGGPELTQMYLTTAGGDRKAGEGAHAGALFRVDGVGRGRPEFHSRVG